MVMPIGLDVTIVVCKILGTILHLGDMIKFVICYQPTVPDRGWLFSWVHVCVCLCVCPSARVYVQSIIFCKQSISKSASLFHQTRALSLDIGDREMIRLWKDAIQNGCHIEATLKHTSTKTQKLWDLVSN